MLLERKKLETQGTGQLSWLKKPQVPKSFNKVTKEGATFLGEDVEDAGTATDGS